MPAKKKIAKSAWMEAISSAGGLVSLIATRLDVHRSTVYRYLNEHPELKEAERDAQEVCKDVAERNIHEALNAKNMKVSMWYLARKARDRGYGTHAKVEPKSKRDSNVLLCLPDDGRDVGEPNAASTR